MRQLAFCLAMVALCVCLVTLSGCHSADGPPRVAPGVRMQDVRFRSAALGREMPYRVFLPETIPAGEKLPVIYLLHGRGPDFTDWSVHSDVSKYALRGLILVMPEGNDSFYVNAYSRPNDRYEDYLIHDVIGDVEARFPVKTGRANRAIIGISMGGYGAVTMALRHPDLFVFSGSLSGALDATERRFRLRRIKQWFFLRGIFGPMGSPERNARDPYLLLKTADPKAVPYLYLTVGEQEPLLEPDRRFAGLLAKGGFRYEFHLSPGHHDWIEWSGQMPGCLARALEELHISDSPATPK